jgi:aldehyde dehydrogenase (NAD+)
MQYIEKGKAQGARLVCGGNRVNRPGHFVETTIFADVKDNMTIAKEEIFGPVMSVMKFKTVDEAIRRANDSEFGLVAGLVTNSLDSAIEVSNALKAGQVFVNCYFALNTNTPFGGFKNSGLGRELGQHGLKNYLETKTIIIKRPDHSLP